MVGQAFTHYKAKLSIHSVYVKSFCLDTGVTHTGVMPKLWSDTIEAHRKAVREATLDTTAALVAEHGLASVTMSQIAEKAGIGRATLYKYFSDVEAILVAWHERQVTGHLQQFAALHQAGQPGKRLRTVLEAYALIHYEHHGTELETLLHRGEHVARAQQHLLGFIQALLTQCATFGEVRNDVAPAELARYCVRALTAASGLPSKAAARRLVMVTLDGLRAAR